MGKKGFTLIELIAVIGILAMLLLVVVPSITSILNRSKENLNDEQVAQIENAARSWGLDNLHLNGNSPSASYVTIGTLKNSGFLEDKTVKSLTKDKVITEDTKICITYEKNQYVYTLEGDC